MNKEKWNKSFKEGKDYTPLNTLFLDDLILFLEKKNGTIKKVLDLGCGTGDTLIKFADKGIRGVGIDFSEEALKKAKNKIKENENISSLIELKEDDLNDFNVSNLDDDFDLVISKLTYAFIDNKIEFLNKVKKITKTGNGSFILITPVLFKGVEYSDFIKNISVPYEKTLEDLNNIFDEVEIFHKNYFGEKGARITFISK